MLHLIGFAPDNHALLARVAALVSTGDDIVLLDDGLGFARGKTMLDSLTQTLGVPVYCCSLEALTDNNIDYAGLVALTEKHQASLSWYE